MGGRAPIRVLVVDDFEPFRRLIVDILKNRSELQIVSEASDGSDAVEKARQLQPDLVLLDIGLPKLNGIEASRRIKEISPLSRILLVSQLLSADVVHEGLRLGATGFVAKLDVTKDLHIGVNSVLRGETFFSRALAGHLLARTRVVSSKLTLDSVSQQRRKTHRHHSAGFYSDDSHLLDDVSQFVGNALMAEDNAIVMATEAHRERLLLRLQVRGLDMNAAIQQKRYAALDASDALQAFMVDGLPDRTRFFALLGDLLNAAPEVTTAGRRVVVFGECVDMLCTQGNDEGALQLEKLGNQMIMAYNIDVLCGYSLDSFQPGTGNTFEKICAEHTAYYSH